MKGLFNNKNRQEYIKKMDGRQIAAILSDVRFDDLIEQMRCDYTQHAEFTDNCVLDREAGIILERLTATLTEEQKTVFMEYESAESERHAIELELHFRAGFEHAMCLLGIRRVD